MDKIDSFVITALQKDAGTISFSFVITEEDIDQAYKQNIVEYIETFVNELNKRIPQFKFTWHEAHRVKPEDVVGEVIHQILVQKVFN